MSGSNQSSPKGNFRLHPGFKTQNEEDESLEDRRCDRPDKLRARRLARALSMSLVTAEHVIRTPEKHIDHKKPRSQQNWSVMPDVSHDKDPEPIEKTSTKSKAIQLSKELEGKNTSNKDDKDTEDEEDIEKAASLPGLLLISAVKEVRQKNKSKILCTAKWLSLEEGAEKAWDLRRQMKKKKK